MSVGSSEVQGAPKRPVGMTFLCLLLGWLTFGALMNSALLFPMVGFPLYMTALGLAYAGSAGAAAVGLWRMRPWGLTAFRAWGLVLLALMIALLWGFDFPIQVVENPAGMLPQLLLVTGVIALVYLLMERYIRRRLPPNS